MTKVLDILGLSIIYGSIANVVKTILNKGKIVLYSGNGEILNNIVFKEIDIIKDSYIIPDGESAVFMIKRLTGKKVDKIAGIDIMNYIINNYKNRKIYLFGANDGVNNTLKRKFLDKGVNIVGGRSGHGYNNDEVVEDINNSGAEILFIALGSPLQEEFIFQEFNRLKAKLIIPVGGAFDVLAGYKKRAPKIFIKLKLEWLWRAILEPKRFKKILHIIKFNFYILILSYRLKDVNVKYNEQKEEI